MTPLPKDLDDKTKRALHAALQRAAQQPLRYRLEPVTELALAASVALVCVSYMSAVFSVVFL